MSHDSRAIPRTKLALATLALVAGAVVWQPIINAAPGPIPATTAIGGLVVLFAAFLPLGLLATWRPWAPMRIALAIAVVASLIASLSFAVQARLESAGSFVILVLIVVLGLTAQLLASPRPRVAFLVLAVLAVVGLYLDSAVALYATSARFGPMVKTSSLPVAIVGTACVAACWHGRRLRNGTQASSLPAAL